MISCGVFVSSWFSMIISRSVHVAAHVNHGFIHVPIPWDALPTVPSGKPLLILQVTLRINLSMGSSLNTPDRFPFTRLVQWTYFH